MTEKPISIFDIHIHVLPAVDDGSQSLEESYEMLRQASLSGVTDMIVTPHYQRRRFFTPLPKIIEEMEKLQDYCDENGLGITLYPGTEIFYYSDIEEKLDNGEVATMNGTNYVLVEFGPLESYSYIRNAIENLFGLGYHPILAHVERYSAFLDNEKAVKDLKNMGCLIQCNTGSIEGKFGLKVKRFLHHLLKQELIDFIGTDAHVAKGTRTAGMENAISRLYRKYDNDYVDAIVYGNAEHYFLEKED